MKLFTSVAVTSLLAVLAATGHAQVIDKKALSLDGKVIGAIGVSGESPAQDEEIAIAGANAAKDLAADTSEAAPGKVTILRQSRRL